LTDLTRKLATIVALDVAGYSARTEANESRTIAQIALLRPVIEGIAQAHGGRIFNTAGDGFMLEFSTALGGVNAALELADECRPRVRVGVHVGEVSQQPNGDLLGHGVNIAARLMAKAEPGSAIISGDVCRMIRGPLADRFVSRGPVQLEKMNETIEVFAPAAPGQKVPPPKTSSAVTKALARSKPRLAAMIGVPVLLVILAVVLWNRSGSSSRETADATTASIAVLPFENLSTDKDNAFFAAGIQDEILTRLSKIGALKVISRTSTAKYASHPDNLPEIARTLGVSNILEGSVQRSGDKVRVNVQLIKADTDEHLWAEIYDRSIADIFTVQSEISTAITQALNAKLSGAERQDLASKPTDNVEAYEAYLLASKRYDGMGDRMILLDIERLLKKAVGLDPKFAQAWALLSTIQAQIDQNLLMSGSNGHNGADYADASRKSLDTAMALQPDLLEVQYARAYFVYREERDLERARGLFEELRDKWPGNIEVLAVLGYIAKRQGRAKDSLDYLSRVVSLDPLSVPNKLELARVQRLVRDYPAARRTLEEALALEPDAPAALDNYAQVLQLMGKIRESADTIRKLKLDNPDVAGTIETQALLERNYAPAIAVLQRTLDSLPANGQVLNMPITLHLELGELHHFAGDAARSRKAYERALDLLRPALAAQPDRPVYLQMMASAQWGLGQREQALRLIEEGLRQPAAKDHNVMRTYETLRVYILAEAGDRDRAIPELVRIMKGEMGNISYAYLRLLPHFDKLRGDPRFDALLRQDPTPP
jgi:TolB-like protein/class 3 adenylate cyclase/tetratricopeptide (TPR) repeat protein